MGEVLKNENKLMGACMNSKKMNIPIVIVAFRIIMRA
jgi:hypothetical protein